MSQKQIFLTLFALFVYLSADGQQDQITIGKHVEITSEILSEERPLIIGLPRYYDPQKKYSLLLLLDGDYHFISAYGTVEYLSKRFLIPDMIVVAIPNTNRVRDLTPSHTLTNFQGQQDASLTDSGGGERFLQFIEQELIPYLRNNYSISNLEILVGHSWGGLTATQSFFDAQGSIDKFIAIDPSYWWDDQYLVQQAAQVQMSNIPNHRRLFISASSLVFEAKQGSCCLQRNSIDLFYATLKNATTQLDQISLAYFEDEDHASVPVPSLYYGLKSVFKDYVLDDYQKKTLTDIQKHFKKYAVSNQAELNPSEDMIRNIGLYQQYAKKNLEAAKVFHYYNYQNFPNSWKACYALANILIDLEEQQEAKELLQRSLKINPNATEVKQLLKTLN